MLKKSNFHLTIIGIFFFFIFLEIYTLFTFSGSKSYNKNNPGVQFFKYQKQNYLCNLEPFSLSQIYMISKKTISNKKVLTIDKLISLESREKSSQCLVYPFKLPLHQPFRISSTFGRRFHPILKKIMFHKGVDMACHRGTKIYPVAPGVVEYAGWRGEYGRLIIIDHRNGYKSYYAHCSRILVKPGKKVSYSSVIGRVGSSGLASGNHLHLEIRKNGKPLNPLSILRPFKRKKGISKFVASNFFDKITHKNF